MKELPSLELQTCLFNGGLSDVRPSIRAAHLTKVYPADPLDYLSRLTFGRLIAGGAEAQAPQLRRAAVDDLSVEFVSGERIGIIGRNGAGKSTLLAMLAGLAEPTSGSVLIDGHVSALMTLGVGLREDLTGRENIYLDGEIQGKQRHETAVLIDEIVEFADIGEFIDYPVRTYSTGMKARLAFAFNIHLDPEILIVDEALSAGDAFFSNKATAKIREICDRGKIVILVSHGIKSIVEICNRCIWLDEGKLAMDGAPRDVGAAYLESIRSSDEAELKERFKQFVGSESFRAGCEISNLRVAAGSTGQPKTHFYQGEACHIRCGVHSSESMRVPELLFRVSRMDGLLICEQRMPRGEAATGHLHGRTIECEISMDSLILGSGVYEVIVELRDAEEVVARATTIIEVQLRKTGAGGHPALICPGRVEVEQRQ